MDDLYLCPECNGDLVFMGVLGNMEWYYCEDCGAEVGFKVEK